MWAEYVKLGGVFDEGRERRVERKGLRGACEYVHGNADLNV